MAGLGKKWEKLREGLREDENLNHSLMSLIRHVHGRMEHADIEKHRQSQDHLGMLFGNHKEIQVREISMGGMYGEWLCLTRPYRRKTVILYCHGGGFSTGSSLYARTLTSKLAESTSMDVLCFDYRLAPEHPYPAAPEDALKAWDYLMLLGYGARDVIVAGDSAGGNLALSLVLRLKEAKRLLPKGILLMSPWTDLTVSGKSFETKASMDPILSKEYIHTMIANYTAGKEDLTDPMISPLYGDFTGFPPVNIQVGQNEILLSDAASLYKKLLGDGVLVKMDVQKGLWHVYQMSSFKKAYEAMERNAAFIHEICR